MTTGGIHHSIASVSTLAGMPPVYRVLHEQVMNAIVARVKDS